MMKVVGPVDSGNYGHLPELSRTEQGKAICDSVTPIVKESLCPLSPACGKDCPHVRSARIESGLAGVDSIPHFVGSPVLPFMPRDIHKAPVGFPLSPQTRLAHS